MSDPFRWQIETIPSQFTEEPDLLGDPLPVAPRLIVAGMGGSGMAGEFLGIYLRKIREVVVIKDDELPRATTPSDVVLCLSYSGETGETLAVWEESAARGLRRAAVASGGSLLRRARDESCSTAVVPTGLAPRASFGYLLRAGMALTAPDVDPSLWRETATHLAGVRERWLGDAERPAARLAEAVDEGLPAFLGVGAAAVAARRWVADLAENAKTPALAWELPESSHNAVMTVCRSAPHRSDLRLFALGRPRSAGSRRRWQATLDVLADHGAQVSRVEDEHSDPWIEALGLAYLGGWVSVLLAERNGVDASDLSLMNDLKRRLAPDTEKRQSSS